MTRDDIIGMAQACWPSDRRMWAVDADLPRLERFAALVRADERNKLIAWMMAQGYTYDTERDKLNEWMGYTASQGNATKDLLTELGWQIEQRIKGLMSDMECQVADRVKAERERFYGQDKPAKCAEGCPPNMVCNYCQVVAPVRAMILAEREACAKVCDELQDYPTVEARHCAEEIRARGQT
jgi:hypothetical protein